MKKIILALLLFTAAARAQTVSQSVTYNENTTAITNPERGLFMELDTKTAGYSGYKPLSVWLTENTNDRLNTLAANNISLIRLMVRLDDFVAKDRLDQMPYDLLARLTTDLQTLRSYHLKCVLRFCYSDVNPTTGYTYEATMDRMLGSPRDGSNTLIPGHIHQLAGVTTLYEDVISSVEAGFIGDWGEWYYSSNPDFGVGDPYLLTSTQRANRTEVATQMLTLAPNRMLAFRTVYFQKMLCPNLNVGKTYPKYNGSVFSRVALYDDAFVRDAFDSGTFQNISGDGGAAERSYLADKSNTTFGGGETSGWDSTYGSCTNAQQRLADYNFNYLNFEYNATVLSNWQTQGCYPTVANKLGYRLRLVDASLTASTKKLLVHLKNEGYGHPINPRPVYLVLRSSAGIDYRVLIAGPTDNDPSSPPAVVTNTEFRSWYVNTSSPTSRITLSKTLDNMTTVTGGAIPSGNYNLYLELPDGCVSCPNNTDPLYSVRFANADGYTDGSGAHSGTFWNVTTTGTIAGLNNLFINAWINSSGTMTRSASTTQGADVFEVSAYPNPFGESFRLDVNTSSGEMMNVRVYDMLGKLLENKNADAEQLESLEIGSGLPVGVYMVSVKQGENEKKMRVVRK